MSTALVCTALVTQQVAAMAATPQGSQLRQDNEQDTAIGFGSGLVLGAVAANLN